MYSVISFLKQRKKTVIAVYVLLGVWVCFKLYFGQVFFLSTAYAYSLLALTGYFVLQQIKAPANVFLAAGTLLVSLFATEVVLRYVAKSHLSYGEQNNNGYIITYRYSKWENIRFKYIEGRHDLYTLQFDSGELRQYSGLDFQYPDFYCNALGFRGSLPDKNKKITLALGDSFTEGAGAPDDSAYPALLRKYLQAGDSSSDVLNAGVSGNDIFFDWQMVHKLENKYRLDRLLFLMNTTDVNDVAIRGGNERFTADGFLQYQAGPWWEPVYALSFVVRLFANNAMNLDYNLQTEEQCLAAHREAINKIAGLIKTEIVPWSKRTGVPVAIALHPLNWEYENATPGNDYAALLIALQDINGVTIIDCLPQLKTKGTGQKLYWPHDQHFKPEGYNIVARYIYQTIYSANSLKL